MEEESARASGYGWYVVAVLTLAHLVSFLDRAVLITAMVPLKAEFRLSDLGLGLLFGPSFVVLYSVATIPLGRLADRINRKWLIASGVTVWMSCTLAFGLAQTVPELFAARIGVGLGEAALVPAALSLIAGYIPRPQLGRAVGIFLLGPLYGTAVAYLVSGVFLNHSRAASYWLQALHLLQPWRLVFLAAAIPAIVTLLLVCTLREAPREPREAGASRPFAGGYLARHRRAFLLHIAASATAVIVLQAVFAWLPTFFVRQFSLNIGFVSSIMGVVTLFVTPLTTVGSGFLLDWFGRRGEPAAPGLILAGSQLLAIPFYLPISLCTSPLPAAVTIVLGQAFHGLTSSAAVAGAQLMTPLRLRGTVTAILMTSITLLGVGLGPPVTGYLSDHWFTGPRAIGESLTVVVVAFGTLAAILAFLSRKPFAAAFKAARREDTEAEAASQPPVTPCPLPLSLNDDVAD